MILITGGAGFIGTHVAKALKAQGKEFVIMDNFSPYYDPAIKWANIESIGGMTDTLIQADICEREQVEYALTKFDITSILHLAAIPGVRASQDHPRRYFLINAYGTASVLSAAKNHGVKQVVIASSSSVYGRSQKPMVETDPCLYPQSPYGASKRAAEIMAYPFTIPPEEMNVTCLRFFNVYGPGGRPDMMPVRVMEHILNKRPIQLFGLGWVERDWTYISDVVAGILAALEKPLAYSILNIGRGQPYDITEFVDIIGEYMGIKPLKEFVELPPGEAPRTCADITQAARFLGYDPKVDLRDGLLKTVEWFNSWEFKHIEK